MNWGVFFAGFREFGPAYPGQSSSDPRATPSSSGLIAELSGDSNAIGENTFSDANLQCFVHDRGAVQIAFGSAWISAAATSRSGETAYASANSAVAFAGADFSLSSTTKWSGNGEYNGQSWSLEETRTCFAAFNIVGWDLPLGSVDSYDTALFDSPQTLPNLQGNVARFNTDARAYGDSSYVAADTFSLATAGFSSVTSSTRAGIGAVGTGAAPIVKGSRSDTIYTGQDHTFVDAGGGSDVVTAGKGSDWIFGDTGGDSIYTGSGNNTVFAGRDNDGVTAQNGDDWIFGGDGRDMIRAGAGHNLVFAGDHNDTILSGSGNDVIDAGEGNDAVDAGSGQNNIRLGSGSQRSDGNDSITTGSGDDLFFLQRNFGRDTINGFSVKQGDRLVTCDESWGLDDADVVLARSKADSRDLTLTFADGQDTSTLTLDNFFLLNTQYGSPLSRAALTPTQTAAILNDILVDGLDDQSVSDRYEYFAIGDYLGLLS